MNPEQQPQSQAKPCEDTIQEFDEALRYLHWQISKIEVQIRRALERVNTVELSTP
jgi:hypothetical protein